MTVYYEQNDDLDRCIVYQNFGFLIPLPKGWDADTTPSVYKKLSGFGKTLRKWGITHEWFGPPYKVVGLNVYKEGYAVADRYDVGEFDQQDGVRTKYGYKDELVTVLSNNAKYGINSLSDLVPNQMFVAEQAVVQATVCDANGNATSGRFLYAPYVSTTPINGNPNNAQGQTKYGSCALTGWQFNGGGSDSVGMYPILMDENKTPFTWNAPGMNIHVKYEGNIPSWAVDWDTKITNSDGTYSVTATNGQVIYTYDPNYSYFYGYDLSGGGQCTLCLELINGSYVPEWFLNKVLFWAANGWDYTIQTCPDIYGVNNYLLINEGFVQFVHFYPYAYYYEEHVAGAQNISFVEYMGNRGFTSEASLDGYVGSGVGEAMGAWYKSQPGYNGETDDFGNFLIMKDTYVSNTELSSLYPKLENITTDYQDPNSIWRKFGIDPTAIQTSIQTQWNTYMNVTAPVLATKMYKSQGYLQTGPGPRSYNRDVAVNLLEQEMLLGTDVNNTNPLMQKDTVNWENFLFDLGFNGFRIDAPMCCNTDILIQCAENMESRFGLENMRNGTNLAINETYDSDRSPQWQSNHGWPDLTMDTPQRNAWGPLWGAQGNPSSNITDVEVYGLSYNNRFGIRKYESFPNWSYFDNHDSRKGTILSFSPTDQAQFADLSDWEMAVYCCDKYYVNIRQKWKIQFVNFMACQALQLTNSKTVPTLYYGDFWEEHKEYMTERTVYYGYLSMIAEMRGRYCFGEYQMQTFLGKYSDIPGHDIMANVRFGINRSTGCAVVVGNNPGNEVEIQVYMGLEHANQKYKNLCLPFSNEVETNENGMLKVTTHGEMSTFVWGHLSIWVPSGQ